MSVRPRKPANRGLPPNLYDNPLRYRHPKTGKVYSWAKYTKAQAIEAAKILNSKFMPSSPVDEVLMDGDRFSIFLAKFRLTHLPERQRERDLSPITIKDYTHKLGHIEKHFGDMVGPEITTQDCSEFLEKFPTVQRNRYRSLLMLIFQYAINDGIVADNPASVTFKKKEKVMRKRLTFEGFMAAYKFAPRWMKDAMDLALHSLQRREDLPVWTFDQIQGTPRRYIEFQQIKTGAAIRMYLNEPFEEVIRRCRTDGVLSRHILHRGVLSKSGYIGKALRPESLTRGFKEARDSSGHFDGSMNERPTFHEIRALGAWLRVKNGTTIKELQTLLGHSSENMTRLYLSRHGIEYKEAEGGLLIREA